MRAPGWSSNPLFLLNYARYLEDKLFSVVVNSVEYRIALEAEKLSDRLADVADRLVRAEALNAALEDEPQRSKPLSHIDDCAQELGRASSGLECPSPPTDDSPGEELLQELMKSQGIEEPE